MNIEVIGRLVKARRYQIKLHAVQHGLKEGFGEREIVEAILSGRLIEQYPERKRVLVCGKASFEMGLLSWLHVVCEQNYPDQIEIVTAYVPAELEWEEPPFKRRQKR
ncbi:MAG TPA: DUF4258 domain-containing protein [Anaerolineales bacterium]|nr:DUF4258 domain-containing protein [Anaerolineales bacterium]